MVSSFRAEVVGKDVDKRTEKREEIRRLRAVHIAAYESDHVRPFEVPAAAPLTVAAPAPVAQPPSLAAVPPFWTQIAALPLC